MANQVHHQLHPLLYCTISQSKSIHSTSILYQKPKFKNHQLTLFSSSLNNLDKKSPEPITKASESNDFNAYQIVKFKTLGSCKLGISRYPNFVYNAEGGSGIGDVKTITSEDEIFVDFDLATLYIPPLTTSTTKFLGLPLPPFLKIDISPELFRGCINWKTGKVDIEFKSKFWFSVGSVYRAPPLIVETVLTSEESRGRIRNGKGKRLDEAGRCRLVGVATVQPIDDLFMNTFLSLPTECLATLNAVISFSM